MTPSALLLCADAEVVQAFRPIFEDLNIAAECCGDVAAAQARFEEVRFDVLLLDCGSTPAALSLIPCARRSRSNRAALIIAVVDDQIQAAQAFTSGTNFILYKPVVREHIARSERGAGAQRKERRTRARKGLNTPADISFAAQDSASVTLMDLSEGGVGLRAPLPISPSCKVYFQFFLPGADGVIRLSGEVVWQKSGRAGIRFVSVPQASQRALKTWLQAHSPVAHITAPEGPATEEAEEQSLTLRLSARLGLLLAASNNQRKLPRYPCRLSAEVHGGESEVPQHCHLSDISSEGCYVETSAPFAIDEPLRIILRAENVRLSLEGKVRMVHPGYGMGVRFTSQTEFQRTQVQRLIDHTQAHK